MRVPVTDGELQCDVIGSGSPVVFLHGFPLSGLMWAHAAIRLPPGHRAIIPDLRGHGRSTASLETSITQLADDVVTLLDAVAPDQQAVFLGLSMGGMICFDIWRRHRPLVRALVLCDTRSNVDTAEAAQRRLALADAALKEGPSAVVDAMLPNLFAPQLDPQLRAHWRSIMLETPTVGLAATQRALASRPDSTATLSTIACPTLVVAGELDTLTPLDSMRRIHESIPSSRLEVIAGAGHVPPVEQPERFSTVLNTFLNSLP
ncbi:MAG: alpha/beta hydrolase [Phycisphaerae bacterium]